MDRYTDCTEKVYRLYRTCVPTVQTGVLTVQTGVPGVGDSEVVIAVSVSRLQPKGIREAEDDRLASPVTDDPAASV